MANAPKEMDVSGMEFVDDAAPTTAAAPVARQEIDLKDDMFLPDYASGLDEKRPIPKSPLSFEDRLKLSVGNSSGKIKYLKQAGYEDAKFNEDNDLLVKKGGLWHQADGSTFGDADAWTATKNIVKTAVGGGIAMVAGKNNKLAKDLLNNDFAKELAGDSADMAPELATLGVSVGAGVATGGASLMAQAGGQMAAGGGMATARTSLGRLAGTYDASNEDQAKEVAFETMLNLAGTVIPAGVKPTAKIVGEGLEKFASITGLKWAGTQTKEAFKKIYGALSIGEDNLDTVLEHAPQVRKTMEEVGSNYKGQGYVDHLKSRSVLAVKEIANRTQEVLNDAYTGIKGKLLSSVGDDFVANIDDIVHGVHDDFLNQGFADVAFNGKVVPRTEVLDLLARNGGKLPSSHKVVLKTQKQILQTMKDAGTLGDGANIGIDDEAYRMVSKYFGQVSQLKGTAAKQGKEAAEQLLNFNKLASDITYGFKMQGDDAGLNVISRMMSKQHELIEGTVKKSFEQRGSGELFSSLNSNYSYLKEQAAPLLAAMKQARKTGDSASYERLLTQLNAKGGKNVTKKLGVDALIDAAGKNGSKAGEAMKRLKHQIRINEAAISVSPYIKEGLLGKGSATFAAGALATGQMQIVAPLAAGAALQSPRLALKGVESLNALWAGKDFASRYGSRLLENPAAVNAFLQPIIGANQYAEQATQMLQQTAAQKIKGQ